MHTPEPTSPVPKKTYLPWIKWPVLIGVIGLVLLALSVCFKPNGRLPLDYLFGWSGLACVLVILLYFLTQTIIRLFERRWLSSLYAFLRFAGMAAAFFATIVAIMFYSMFGPSEDGFADNLVIPDDIEISEPIADSAGSRFNGEMTGTDAMQTTVKAALEIAGSNDPSILPSLPSLRRAATEFPEEFLEFLEASPDWHIFMEQGNRFASRRWSYNGEPRNTLHGYISSFGGESSFQTRTLLCLDRKQWSRYKVEKIKEGSASFTPKITQGNNMHESRFMLECGAVWLELFEQSNTRERRVTKASIHVLESEFSEFLKDPAAAVELARQQSREIAMRNADPSGQPFQLLIGMQPGIYGVSYSLNPGEPGLVFLKAYEVTQGTRLSKGRLRSSSETRMAWSDNPKEIFNAKAGFTIYEGDWGKPYAARFEVWFKPDSGKPERKLAQRNFKIEGWMR